MLISFDEIRALTPEFKLRGVLHVGAHLCQEEPLYLAEGVPFDRIVWVEGYHEIAEEARAQRPRRRILEAVVSDVDDTEVTFYVASNRGASSAISPFDTHMGLYPEIKVVAERKVRTTTLQTLFAREGLAELDLNFLCLDIQGAELRALRGMGSELLVIEAESIKIRAADRKVDITDLIEDEIVFLKQGDKLGFGMQPAVEFTQVVVVGFKPGNGDEVALGQLGQGCQIECA
jgi:FkbM family methyltransferase